MGNRAFGLVDRHAIGGAWRGLRELMSVEGRARPEGLSPTLDDMPIRTSTRRPQPPPFTPPAGWAPAHAPGRASPQTPGPITANDASWRRFNASTVVPRARMTSFSTPAMNSAGLVDVEWDKPGDTLRFEMTLEIEHGRAADVLAELWTNANNNADPEHYQAVPMQLVSVQGRTARYAVDLPLHNVGNYRAVGRFSVDGGQSFTWMSSIGAQDIRFRPRDERHEQLNITEVSVGNLNFDGATGTPGTFADLMASGSPDTNGNYTLEWLKAQGKNAIWMMPPFEHYKWPDRPDVDDAGSPYAVSDFFSVRTELAASARGLDGEAAREAALGEFKAFMAKARDLGIKVILDLPLNHVGHDYTFRDLFITTDAQGNEVREVRKNDYSQVAISDQQLATINHRLASPNVPNTMDVVAPWMYGSRAGNPWGAQSFYDRAIGGWFEWMDTAQLNHGRRRVEPYRWVEHGEKNDQQDAVIDWLSRVMRYWAVDMGVDGFRLDHLAGLPEEVLELAANVSQADVDRHRPGETLFFLGEDFHNRQQTTPWVDAAQAWYFHDFINARSPQDFEGAVESPIFHDILAVSNHDEPRVLERLGGDRNAYRRLTTLLQLFGGPTGDLAGDQFGVHDRMPFKQYRGVHELRTIEPEEARMAAALRKVSLVRRDMPALHDDNRAFLHARHGHEDRLLAMSRLPDDPNQPAAIVFSNLDNHHTRENVFHLDDALRSRIDPHARYQVVDKLADPPTPLWGQGLLGRDLLEQGIFARVGPYDTQVLELTRAW
jgi:hypothetical protein